MTNGSSQGLFVVVAVVIFGIFVAISYSLFRDTLTPSLASIFQDSLVKTQEETIPYSILSEISESYALKGKVEVVPSSFVYEFNINPHDFTSPYVGFSTYDLIEIPWEHKLIIVYDIMHNGTSSVKTAFDFNSYPTGGGVSSWDGNDNYGDYISNRNLNISTKPNVWNTIVGEYSNNSSDNIGEVSLFEGKQSGGYGSVLGVKRNDAVKYNVTNLKIKNVRYKIVPM